MSISRVIHFLIVVPHIFWVRIFTLRALSPSPLPPLLKGKGGDAPLAPPSPASLYISMETLKDLIKLINHRLRAHIQFMNYVYISLIKCRDTLYQI
jgi:hypothetical protein